MQRHIVRVGRLCISAFLFIGGIPKGTVRWCVDLFYIKDTLGFSLATGLFSLLVGVFFTIQLAFRYGLNFNDANTAVFWGIFAALAGALQLYAISVNKLKLRQVAAIVQLLMYLFFLSLTILSGGALLLSAIILTQIILLLVSSIRLTQELKNARR